MSFQYKIQIIKAIMKGRKRNIKTKYHKRQYLQTIKKIQEGKKGENNNRNKNKNKAKEVRDAIYSFVIK
jgi:hypothetical protein